LSRIGRAGDWLVAGIVLLVGRRKRRPTHEPAPRAGLEAPPNAGAESLALVLLALGSACAIAFVVVYAVDSIPAQTQFLGLTLGLALLFLAAALVVTGRKLVVSEELADEYPPRAHEGEQELVSHLVDQGSERLTRRRLFKLGLVGAGGALGLALITPALSLGPFFDTKGYRLTPWRRGRRLVDEQGRPWKAADIEEDNLYTAFAEGANREALASSLVLVRLPPGDLDLPDTLRGYDADGIVAYSKICTHAGCAVAMYRAPLFQPAEPRPALVCPCHYSTFDPASGGRVLFGPAGRPLPMLPIAVDEQGFLRAAGNFDEQIGPSWWGVRLQGPET
jgi:quinol---cytochrome c reductase iron-sulfur subunit